MRVPCGAICLIALFVALSNQETSASKQLAPQSLTRNRKLIWIGRFLGSAPEQRLAAQTPSGEPLRQPFRKRKIMTENVFTLPDAKSPSLKRPRAFNAIVYGGLAVGVLDGLAAVILTIYFGRSVSVMFQYIASGLIGRASFQGGWATVLLGVSLHFLIAFIWTAIYFGASLKLPALIRRALICGPIYGLVVYFAMQRIVLPLSAVQSPPFSFAGMMRGIIVHILCVGLPIALLAQRSARSK
jgi:hypothetical protein